MEMTTVPEFLLSSTIADCNEQAKIAGKSLPLPCINLHKIVSHKLQNLVDSRTRQSVINQILNYH